MTPIKIILNPVAGRGLSRKSEPEIINHMKEMELEFDLIHTKEKGHATELAEKAVLDGYKMVVGVGGDGTSNEVVNGMMNASAKGKDAIYAPFAAGSGSDFSFNAGMPKDLREACGRLKNGNVRKLDLGKISVPGQPDRYVDNQLGIGFDGVVTLVAKRYKRLRGTALYLPVVLQTIFTVNKPTRVEIEIDGEKLNLTTYQISLANGSREGGAFFMAPGAEMDDGYFDIVILEEVSKMAMLGLVPKFMNATHIHHKAVRTLKGKKIKITSPDNLISHYDGEMLFEDGHEVTCEVIPKALSVIS